MCDLDKKVAESLLQIKAIKLNPTNHFTWASGWYSPIYCDNRKILSYPAVRKEIYEGFVKIISEKYPDADIIAGVATGAIAHGVLVAEKMGKPFIYVRSSPKSHGLTNQVEGEYWPGAKVVVVEDLVSTGGSSLSAVEALREAGFDVMKAENMELLTVRGYTDELWRRYARGPQVFVRQATQSTVRVVRKRE